MDFIFSIPTPPPAFIFSAPQQPIGFVFGIKNVLIINKMFKEITVVTGDIDGSSTDFLLQHEAAMVVKNGAILKEGVDYTKTGLTVTFNSPPFFDMDDSNNTDKLQFWGNF